MHRTIGVIVMLCVFTGLAEHASAARKTYSHQEYFEHYEGTKTCLECHEDEATDFFHTRHYQWKGESPGIVNADGELLGKFNMLNDFCTSPGPNWIGKVQNSDGQVLARGCSACHAGLGEKPEPEVSQAQLENIDCLICHASGYRRDLYEDDEGEWEWRSILWKNERGLDSVSKRISLPDRKMCLRCHSGAGGGPNFKRGDIEYALADCDEDFDVHMAKEGNDLSCADCHGGENHRFRGRGADMAGPDPLALPLSCENCHEGDVHGIKVLDHHTEKVDCTVCHIPTFAKSDPTDMRRDWSTPNYHEDGNRYSATITFESDVVPVYRWFNGKSRVQKMGEKVRWADDGSVPISEPQGRRKDKDSKIFAFKLHRGVLPMLVEEEFLVPIAVEEFFADGDIVKAVDEGAAFAYGIHEADVEWVEVSRYMGIYHEVQPAKNALQCLDCHREDGRMDWEALGYKKDPLIDVID